MSFSGLRGGTNTWFFMFFFCLLKECKTLVWKPFKQEKSPESTDKWQYFLRSCFCLSLFLPHFLFLRRRQLWHFIIFICCWLWRSIIQFYIAPTTKAQQQRLSPKTLGWAIDPHQETTLYYKSTCTSKSKNSKYEMRTTIKRLDALTASEWWQT